MDNFRLKPLTTQAPSHARAVAEIQDGQDLQGAENRAGVRHAVCADAIIIDASSNTRLTGRAADLSLGGCYLDAINTFPVAALVRLRLTAEGHSFECEARVSYSVQGMGMGIAFTKTSAEQAAELRNWIAELSGELGPTASFGPDLGFDRRKPTATENDAGWQSALADLVTLLHRKGLLDESETNSLRSRLAH